MDTGYSDKSLDARRQNIACMQRDVSSRDTILDVGCFDNREELKDLNREKKLLANVCVE